MVAIKVNDYSAICEICHIYTLLGEIWRGENLTQLAQNGKNRQIKSAAPN